MADYHIFIRVEAQQQPDKGAAPGDVISMRPANAKITSTEKKKLLILKIDMITSEVLEIRDEIRPRASFEDIGTPPTDPAAHLVYMDTMAAERVKLNSYGKEVALTTTNFTQKQLDDIADFSKECEPIRKNKAIIKQATTVI